MLGDLIDPQAGACFCNFIHQRTVAVVLYVPGVQLSADILQLLRTILFAHSSLDRVFHFGLQYVDRFEHTHLEE